MHIITCDCHVVTEKTKQPPQTCLNCMFNQIPIVLLAKLPCWWAKKTLLIVWQPFNLGLVKNGWIDSIRDCSCANSTNNNAHNKACCNVYANVFSARSLWTGMWMSQLFLELQSPQSAGYCLYHSTWIVVKSAEATQVITQPTQIINDPGS